MNALTRVFDAIYLLRNDNDSHEHPIDRVKAKEIREERPMVVLD